MRGKRVLTFGVAPALGVALAALFYARSLVPSLAGRAHVAGLVAQVTVHADRLGIPTIEAETRADALAALGYVSARDRMFQMDLLRRQARGALAEIFGAELVEHDRTQRHYGFAAAAAAALAQLPDSQRKALEAYAGGVNAWLAGRSLMPLEFQLLGYRPEPWRPEDSVLVVLGMFQVLSASEELERTRTVLARTLPQAVTAFLTSDVDRYTRALLGGEAAPQPPLPEAALRALASRERRARLSSRAGEAPIGSNGFAVAGARTRDGRAILANDMHLDLSLPNVWYRAQLRYEGKTISGLSLPGVPLIVTGSNGQVAWGLTNLEGDVLDLVELEEDGAHPGAYRTPGGYRPYECARERIAVRGEPSVEIEVRRTLWGPVSPRPLLGRPVAVRFSALLGDALDFGLLALDQARDVDDAVRALNRAGMPPLNAIVADARGRVAWTLTGRIPQRRGFDGSVARSWANGDAAWGRYVAPERLPRELDPARGFVVNANQRMALPPDAPLLGRDFVHGYRAYRIASELANGRALSEQALFALQLDTRSEPFELYRELALAGLGELAADEAAPLADVRRALAAWDGRADCDSVGFALLRQFRRRVIERVLGAFLAPAQAKEPTLALQLADVDTPVLRALTEGSDALFAFAGSRKRLLREELLASAQELRDEHGESVATLTWGAVSKVTLAHPLSAIPGLGALLDMPRAPLAGCGLCVRMNAGALGASERMVVSPGRERDAILHMPGGQSGHPLSDHYGDQEQAWVEGRALPFSPGPNIHTLQLVPGSSN